MTRPPPEERPTAQQLAAQSLGVDAQPCPYCKRTAWVSGNSFVETTRPNGERVITRYRICVCGNHRRKTTEVEVPPGHRLVLVPTDEDAA